MYTHTHYVAPEEL